MKKNSFLTGLMALLGCNQHKAVETFPIQAFTRVTDEGFEDIRLSITRIERTKSHTIITAHSTLKNDTIGLMAHLPMQMPGDKGFGEGILLSSSGSASNHLLYELAKLYEVPLLPDARFVSNIAARYVDLDEFAQAVAGGNNKQQGLTKLKLFLESEEGDMAEFYLNIHLDEHWLEICEKEDSFREVMIKLLQER